MSEPQPSREPAPASAGAASAGGGDPGWPGNNGGGGQPHTGGGPPNQNNWRQNNSMQYNSRLWNRGRADSGSYKKRVWNNYNHRDTPYRRHNNTNYGNNRGRQGNDYTQRTDYNNYRERQDRSGEGGLERSPRQPRQPEDSYRNFGRYHHHYRDQQLRYPRWSFEENTAQDTFLHNDSVGTEGGSHPSEPTGDLVELAEKKTNLEPKTEPSKVDQRNDKSLDENLKSPNKNKSSKDIPIAGASLASLKAPRIQVRPLTQLLRQEILAVTQENRLSKRPVGSLTPPAPISSPGRHTFKPLPKLRRRTVSSSNQNGATSSGSQFADSEAIIHNRIAGMDKESLKYIINNSDTIYDEHLKIQARKRLREEIRRQLKAALEQPEDNRVTELVEDEIVDAIKLPEFLLKEIEKCFGKEFVEDQKLQETEENLKNNKDLQASEGCNKDSAANSKDSAANSKDSAGNSKDNEQSGGKSMYQTNEKPFRIEKECNCNQNKVAEESSENHNTICALRDIIQDKSDGGDDHLNRIDSETNSNQNIIAEESAENHNTKQQFIQDNNNQADDDLNKKLNVEALPKKRKDKRNQKKLEIKMKRSKDLMARLKAADEVKTMAEKRLAKNRGPLLPTPAGGRTSNKFNLPTDQNKATDISQKKNVKDPKAVGSESEITANISTPETIAPLNTEVNIEQSASSPTREKTPILSKSKNQASKTTQSSKQKPKSKNIKSTSADINIPLRTKIKSECNASPIRISPLPHDVIELLSSSEEDVDVAENMEIDEPEGKRSLVDTEEQAMELEPDPQYETIDDCASEHSSSSHCSTESEKRRFKLKLQNDAENVVDSFEKLILPHLRETLSDRYHFQHSANLQSRLHFISCVVTSSEHNAKEFSKNDVAKIQRNLKAPDNRKGIEFLLKEIVSVVSLQKQRRRAQEEHESPKKAEQAVKETPKASSSTSCHHSSPIVSIDQRPQTLPAHQSPLASTSVVSQSPSAAHQSLSALPAIQNPQPHPIGLPFMSLDSHFYRFPPSGYTPLTNGTDKPESVSQMGDLLCQNITEIDRHLMENQNRRSILEEMISKFQKEISHLDKQNLELQSRKIMLLISSNQAVTAAAPPPPAVPSRNSPPSVSSTQEATQEETNTQTKSKTRFRLVKLMPRRVKRLPKRATRKSAKSKGLTASQKDADNEEYDQGQAQEEESRLENLSDVKDEIQDDTVCDVVADSLPTVKPKTTPLTKPKANASKHPLAVIPPLPPPPPPPEPICPLSEEMQPSPDYPEQNSQSNEGFIPRGMLHDVVSPITQLRIFRDYVIAASEDGDIYMFHLISHKLERKITKHSEAITNMFLSENDGVLYTTSLDCFFKKTSLENLERVMQTVYFKEPLQSIDIAWGVAFIGSRWGNIFAFNVITNKPAEMSLVSTNQSIIAIKATKEGVRRILILGCKGSSIYINDASNGLLLRRLCVPEGLNVYSLLLSDGHIYCGTQKNQIYQFEFATGNLVTKMYCGNGAVSIVSYKERYLLAGCYDGFIYVLDKVTGKQVGRFEGAGRLVLALAVAGDKIVTSSKDNSLGILEVPTAMVNDQ
ncbi:hypothetical protein KR032_000277 [Drosophila birchii]|nr:hypothetical protein KR032_000277 [Drosophila birchii]